ncbi:putative transporter small subunit [Citricoccus sp. GCM10030269]
MTIALTAYVLMWPVIVALVLFFVGRGFIRDVSESKKAGRPII